MRSELLRTDFKMEKRFHLILVLMFCAFLIPQHVLGKLGSSRHNGLVLEIDKKLETLELMKMSQGTFVMLMTAREFRQLIFSTPRNHSAFVLFYNNKNRNRQCPDCEDALEAFDRISMAYSATVQKTPSEQSLFFAVIQIDDDARKKMKSLKLNPTKPNFYYFPESVYKKYNPYSKMVPYNVTGYGAEERIISTWIKDVSGIFINLRLAYQEPSSSNMKIMTLVFGAMLIFSLMRHSKKFNINSIYNSFRNVNFDYLIMLALMWLISGQMFNYIRGSGLAMHGREGLVLIHPSQRNQLIIETYFVMCLYATMCYCLVKIIELKVAQVEAKKPFSSVSKFVEKAAMGFFIGFVGLTTLVRMKGH